ncbi:MAG: malate dehydrogenase [Phycisphaera sp.]|nr:malate dehydrogenase [Phycisphaera sp.]
MRRAKISIIGAGNTGAACAVWAASKELADIVLIDINDGVAKGKALDLYESAPIEGFDCKIEGGSDYALIKDSDIVVITAGLPRKPGMSRDDLIVTNMKIVSEVAEKVAQNAPNSIIIVLSNPLDAMVYTAWKSSGFPAHRVLGQAGCLDVARFRAFLSLELGCSIEDIQALLLGGHGDDMVPLPRFTSVHGIPIDQLLPKETIDKCVQRAKVGGGEIVQLMGTSAYYAPASGVIQMAEAIIKDKKRILPCAAYCEDAFGVAPGAKGAGYFVGVPCVLGKGGMERIVEIKMNADEQALFNESAQHVKDLVKVVKDLAAKPNEQGQPSFPKLV